ncbi:MAG: FIST C-terminal domain-containing protein [Candidatus Omnitrophota bacterium]
MEEKFAIAFSEKDREKAAKEVSLKIKLSFPRQINHLLVFFTPHYDPSNILKTINFTLKPKTIHGAQAPFLIFEDKIISKGIVACCINKKEVELKEGFLKNGRAQEIESFLNTYFGKLNRKDFCLLSFMSVQINPYSYLNGTRSSLGKFFNLTGAGYIKKYSSYSSQIINDKANEGLLNLAVKGLDSHSIKLGGWIPLGKPFIITKASASKDVIIEINSQPAVHIFKHYLEDKFETFMKNRLFSFYPLGIGPAKEIQLINIIDCLEDGSLACIGEVKEGESGHIMFLDSSLILKSLSQRLAPFKSKNESLIFIVNSLTRKKALKEVYTEEIQTIKHILGNQAKIIGLYSDYVVFSDKEKGGLSLESGNLLLNSWQ